MVSKIYLLTSSLAFLIILNLIVGFFSATINNTTYNTTIPNTSFDVNVINASSTAPVSTEVIENKTSNSTTISTYLNPNTGNSGLFGLNLNWLIYPFLLFYNGVKLAYSNVLNPNVNIAVISTILSIIDSLLILIIVFSITPYIGGN